MTHPNHNQNHQNNGASLEDCHTNFFALTDLCGIKWRKITWQYSGTSSGGGSGPASGANSSAPNYPQSYRQNANNFNAPQQSPPSASLSASSPPPQPQQPQPQQQQSSSLYDDPVLQTYSKCLQADILCVWRRLPPHSQQQQTQNASFFDNLTQVPSMYSQQQQQQQQQQKDQNNQPNSLNFSLAVSKELWVFWYGEEPDISSLLAPELKSAESEYGSWESGLSYECRSLLFKALHNLIERCLLSRNFVRLGKWFVQPYQGQRPDHCDSNSVENDDSGNNSITHASFSFSFFVHGESTVCASIDVRQHPTVRRLTKTHFVRSQRLEKGLPVILAPFGLLGHLNGAQKQQKEPSAGVAAPQNCCPSQPVHSLPTVHHHSQQYHHPHLHQQQPLPPPPPPPPQSSHLHSLNSYPHSGLHSQQPSILHPNQQFHGQAHQFAGSQMQHHPLSHTSPSSVSHLPNSASFLDGSSNSASPATTNNNKLLDDWTKFFPIKRTSVPDCCLLQKNNDDCAGAAASARITDSLRSQQQSDLQHNFNNHQHHQQSHHHSQQQQQQQQQQPQPQQQSQQQPQQSQQQQSQHSHQPLISSQHYLPNVVEVIVGGVRMKYPSCYVLVTDMDQIMSPSPIDFDNHFKDENRNSKSGGSAAVACTTAAGPTTTTTTTNSVLPSPLPSPMTPQALPARLPPLLLPSTRVPLLETSAECGGCDDNKRRIGSSDGSRRSNSIRSASFMAEIKPYPLPFKASLLLSERVWQECIMHGGSKSAPADPNNNSSNNNGASSRGLSSAAASGNWDYTDPLAKATCSCLRCEEQPQHQQQINSNCGTPHEGNPASYPRTHESLAIASVGSPPPSVSMPASPLPNPNSVTSSLGGAGVSVGPASGDQIVQLPMLSASPPNLLHQPQQQQQQQQHHHHHFHHPANQHNQPLPPPPPQQQQQHHHQMQHESPNSSSSLMMLDQQPKSNCSNAAVTMLASSSSSSSTTATSSVPSSISPLKVPDDQQSQPQSHPTNGSSSFVSLKRPVLVPKDGDSDPQNDDLTLDKLYDYSAMDVWLSHPVKKIKTEPKPYSDCSTGFDDQVDFGRNTSAAIGLAHDDQMKSQSPYFMHHQQQQQQQQQQMQLHQMLEVKQIKEESMAMMGLDDQNDHILEDHKEDIPIVIKDEPHDSLSGCLLQVQTPPSSVKSSNQTDDFVQQQHQQQQQQQQQHQQGQSCSSSSSKNSCGGNISVLRPEELSKMFPTPPSLENNTMASPCGGTQSDMLTGSDLYGYGSCDLQQQPPHSNSTNVINSNYNFLDDAHGILTPGACDDPSLFSSAPPLVFKPALICKIIDSAKYAPLTDFPSRELPPFYVPAHLSYIPSWLSVSSASVTDKSPSKIKIQQKLGLMQTTPVQQQPQSAQLRQSPHMPMNNPVGQASPFCLPPRSHSTSGGNVIPVSIPSPASSMYSQNSAYGSGSGGGGGGVGGVGHLSLRPPPPPYSPASGPTNMPYPISQHFNPHHHQLQHPQNLHPQHHPGAHLHAVQHQMPTTVQMAQTSLRIPEVNSLVVTLILSDTALNIFRDHNFDSCSLCVCNAGQKVVGNIRGADASMYLIPSQNSSLSLLAQSLGHGYNSLPSMGAGAGGGASSGQYQSHASGGHSMYCSSSSCNMNHSQQMFHHSGGMMFQQHHHHGGHAHSGPPSSATTPTPASSGNPANNASSVDEEPICCNCGFSAIVNRRLCHKAGLFYEDELEIAGLAEDPAVAKKHSLITFLTSSSVTTTNRILDGSAAAAKTTPANPDSNAVNREKSLNHLPHSILELVREQCFMLQSMSNSLHRAARLDSYRNRNRLARYSSTINFLEFSDSNDLIRLLLEYFVRQAAERLKQQQLQHQQQQQQQQHQYYQNRPSTASALAYESAQSWQHALQSALHMLNSNSVIHKWQFLRASGPNSNQDIVRIMKYLQPLLQDSIHKKCNTRLWDAPYTVKGPLTWRQFHRLAGRGTDDRCEPQPIPSIVVGHDKDWLSLSPYALQYWDKLLLEPYSTSRDVAYIVVAPDNDAILPKVKHFFRELSSTYEVCKLGRHSPISRVLRDGILRVGKNAKMKLANEPVDDWFTLLASMAPASVDIADTIDMLKLYAQVCKHHLAPLLLHVPMDRSLLDPPEINSYQQQQQQQQQRPQTPQQQQFQSPHLNTAPFSSTSQQHNPFYSSASGNSSGDKSQAVNCGFNSGNVQGGGLPLSSDQAAAAQGASSATVTDNRAPTPKSDSVENADVNLTNLLDSNQDDEIQEIPSIVIYLVEPFTMGSDNSDLQRLSCLALLRSFQSVLSAIPEPIRTNINVQIISQESIVELGKARESKKRSSHMQNLALSVFSQNRRYLQHTSNPKSYTGFGTSAATDLFMKNKDEKSRTQFRMYTPPYVLASTCDKSESADTFSQNNEQCSVMYVSYCLSQDQRWLLGAVTDDRGELFETVVVNIDVPNRTRRKKVSARRNGLQKLMDFILGIMSQSTRPWRLIIGRLGRIGHGELKGWSWLLSRKVLMKSSKQFKEICKQCSLSYPNNTPSVLSACLVSIEPDSTLRLMPDQCTPDERFSQTSINRTLSTPHDVSCTHILVFPTSATTQSSQTAFQEQHINGPELGDDELLSALNDDMPDGLDNMNDFTDIFNWTDAGVGGGNSPGASPRRHESRSGSPSCGLDSLDRRSPYQCGGPGGSGGVGGGGGGSGGASGSRGLDAAEEVGTLLQQPLALGFLVSTAPTGRMPHWFWSSCPHLEDVCPVFLKNALHLHSPNIQQSSEDILQQTNVTSHPLDSQFTTDVLRYVLEGYNALSWLAPDPNSHDRLSCLPVHIQILVQLYHMTSSVI